MTKRKSRGPETDRWCRNAQTPQKRNAAAYGWAIGNGHVRIPSKAQGEEKEKKEYTPQNVGMAQDCIGLPW